MCLGLTRGINKAGGPTENVTYDARNSTAGSNPALFGIFLDAPLARESMGRGFGGLAAKPGVCGPVADRLWVGVGGCVSGRHVAETAERLFGVFRQWNPGAPNQLHGPVRPTCQVSPPDEERGSRAEHGRVDKIGPNRKGPERSLDRTAKLDKRTSPCRTRLRGDLREGNLRNARSVEVLEAVLVVEGLFVSGGAVDRHRGFSSLDWRSHLVTSNPNTQRVTRRHVRFVGHRAAPRLASIGTASTWSQRTESCCRMTWATFGRRGRRHRCRRTSRYQERFVLSIKTECLDRMILFSERALRRAASSYLTHYHGERFHQGLGNRLIEGDDSVGERSGAIRCRERLGGMLRYYYRQAA